MLKEDVLSRIRSTGVVAVIRAETGEEAIRIADACLAGGIQAVEITFTVHGALGVMRDLRKRYGDEILLGAGTVLDPETARAALLEGASYIVAPSLNLETVRLCHRYRVACMPGAMTVREVVDVMESGADVVKVFPGESLGPTFIKAVRGPLPQAQMMPTGGVSLENVKDWIQAGAIAVGVGGQLTAPAKTGNFDAVARDARRFVDAVREARA